MNSGATAERVYDALKRQLLSGEILPGERLDPNRFAEELNSSVTPVRDALHRLAGERLVETRVSEGFHLPQMTEPGLRDLYSWNLMLLRGAVGAGPRQAGTLEPVDLDTDIERAASTLFESFAAITGNLEIVAQVVGTNDRLASARKAEPRCLDGLEDELRDFAEGSDPEAAKSVVRRLQAYHRRRLRAVPDIVRAMYRRQ